MLFGIDGSGASHKIENVPHKDQFQVWSDRLSPEEYRAVLAHLGALVGEDEIKTSSWMPGADWTGTPLQVLYEKACGRNTEQAALFFGLALWDVIIRRKEAWGFGRYEKDGRPIGGMTYFRLPGLDQR